MLQCSSVSYSLLLSSFTSLWHLNALTRCPDLVDHISRSRYYLGLRNVIKANAEWSCTKKMPYTTKRREQVLAPVRVKIEHLCLAQVLGAFAC